MDDIEKNTGKWKDIPCSSNERINIVKIEIVKYCLNLSKDSK
jgi:hypothetical protein